MSRITKTVAIVGAEHPESLQAWEFLRDDPSTGFLCILVIISFCVSILKYII